MSCDNEDGSSADYAKAESEYNALLDKYVQDGFASKVAASDEEDNLASRSADGETDITDEDEEYYSFKSVDAADRFMEELRVILNENGIVDPADASGEANDISSESTDDAISDTETTRATSFPYTGSQISAYYDRGGRRDCEFIGSDLLGHKKYFCAYSAAAYMYPPLPVVNSIHKIRVKIDDGDARTSEVGESRYNSTAVTRRGRGTKSATATFTLTWPGHTETFTVHM